MSFALQDSIIEFHRLEYEIKLSTFNRFECYCPEGRLPYKRLMGMCRWMGSHFQDWIDFNGVAFSIE